VKRNGNVSKYDLSRPREYPQKTKHWLCTTSEQGKKECSSVFQIQSMDMWRNISPNNWDYLFCPIQSPNRKGSCFLLNPFKTRQELLQSHLNRWARDLMLESQLHSEAMTCAQSSGFQIGVAIMHFWDSMSPLISFHSWGIWNGFEEDQTAV